MNALKKKEETVLLWGFVVLAAICVLSFLYSDAMFNFGHGISFWDAIAEGKPLSFYEYAVHVEVLDGFCNAHYPFSTYLLLAVWNFPIWLIVRITGIDPYTNLLCMVWMKLFYLFFVALSVRGIVRIAGGYTKQAVDSRQLVLYYCGSALVFTSALVISQFEIVTVAIMLLGVEKYLQGNKRGFLLWFALAISFKFFALVAFLPLVFLREKKPTKILLDLLAGCSLSLFFVALFWNAPHGNDTILNPTRMVDRMMESSLPISFANVCIPVVCLAAIILYSYCCAGMREAKGAWKPLSDQERDWVLYICLMALASFFLSWYTYPYWLVMFQPFLVLCIFRARRARKLSMLLETGFSLCITFAQMCVFGWCFGFHNMARMLPGMATGVLLPEVGNFFEGLLMFVGLRGVAPVGFISVGLVFMVGLLYLLYPGRREGQAFALYDGEDVFSLRGIHWLRFLCIAFLVLGSVGSYAGRVWLGF